MCFGMTMAEEVFQDLQLLKKISGKWNGNNKMGCIFWCRQLRFDIIHERLAKDDEYPGGRFLMAETQAEWDIISKFHSNDPKTHTFYGKYFCCWIFVCSID